MVNNPNHDEEPEPIEKDEYESTPLPGNRPADNALRATAESDLNLSWQGGEGAADFLGLDQDLGRPAPVSIELDDTSAESASPLFAEQPTIPLEESAPPGELQMAPVYTEPESAAPLAEEFDAEPQEFATEAPPETLETATDDSNWLLDVDEGSEENFDEPSYEEDPALEFEMAGALDSSFSEESSPRGSRRLVLLASLVVLTAGGTWFMSGGSNSEQPVEVASVDSPIANTPPAETSPETSTEVPESSLANNTTESTSTEEDAELMAELAGLIAESEGGKAQPANVNAPTPEATTGAEDSTVAVAPQEPEAAINEGDRAERVVQLNTSEMVLLPDYSSSLRLASESELGMLWPESTIPFDRFDAEKRLLTPKVGRVRVVITGDEIFEGELYAVGEGQVWIDSKIGRVALATESVRDVQQLSGNESTPELGGADSQRLAGLPRVRVKGAGGNFYGKVVAREGSMVTLIPDSGGRIRLQSSEIEVVGNMRTSLVRAELE